MHLFKYIRTIKKCSNNSTSYEVEDKCDSTLQFSTLVELESEKVVRPCVCPSAVFPGNRAKDFAETWSECKGG